MRHIHLALLCTAMTACFTPISNDDAASSGSSGDSSTSAASADVENSSSTTTDGDSTSNGTGTGTGTGTDTTSTGESESDGGASETSVLGVPHCTPGESRCVDDEPLSIYQCNDGPVETQWTKESCKDACGDAEPFGKERCIRGLNGEESCACLIPCTKGQTMCGKNTLFTCVDGGFVPETDCNDFCKQHKQDLTTCSPAAGCICN